MVAAEEPDLVLVGGDISNGIASLTHLANLAAFINKQFYFVLGNHDFYYGSIAQTRIQAYELTLFNPKVHYLTNNGIISLTKHTALIGHDGWSDALAGDYMNSEVMLNDYRLIEEFRQLNKIERKQKLHDLGDEAARYLKRQLLKALKTHERVVLLTQCPLLKKRPLWMEWRVMLIGRLILSAKPPAIPRKASCSTIQKNNCSSFAATATAARIFISCLTYALLPVKASWACLIFKA